MKITITGKPLDELEIISRHGLFGKLKQNHPNNTHISATPIKKISGVYLIFSAGELLRVGQATDIWSRLNEHHYSGNFKRNHQGCIKKYWDSFAIIKSNDDNTKYIIELFYALYYKPKYNKKLMFGV
jgi:hypothetical protein